MEANNNEAQKSSTPSAAAEEALRIKLQRDVNCLYDPDRNTRRQALIRIKKAVLDDVPKDAAARQGVAIFFKHYLKKALLTLVSDPVEKLRETVTQILSSYIAPNGVLSGVADRQEIAAEVVADAIPIFRNRIGVAPFAESAEEVRLQLLKVINLLLDEDRCWAVLKEKSLISDVAAIAARCFSDPFPDVKREVCCTVDLLAHRSPKDLRLHQAVLLQGLMPNLAHQHSKVRQLAVQALGNVISCGSDSMERLILETVLPAMKKLVFDRTPAIRRELVAMVSKLLRHDDQRFFKSSEGDLLLVLLLGLSDEAAEVQDAAKAELEAVGKAWVARRQEDEGAMLTETDDATAAFDHVPGSDIEVMARALLPTMVPKVLDDLSHWTLRMRHRSVLLLASLVQLAGDSITAFLPQILASLTSTIHPDEEPEVLSAVKTCGRAIGGVVDPAAVLHQLLPQICGQRAGQGGVQHRASALLLLTSVLSGMPGEEPLTPAQIEAVSGAVVDPGILEAEGPDAWLIGEALCELLTAVVTRCPQHCGPAGKPRSRIVRAAVQMLGAPHGPRAQPIRDGAMRVLQAVGGLAGLGSEGAGAQNSAQQLLAAHLPELLNDLKNGPWFKDAPQRLAFDALVREARVGVGLHMGLVVPVLIDQLKVENDAELRLSMMLLLETIVSSPTCHAALPIHAHTLISSALLPNIVWKAGRVASTVRKVALVCLYTLFREDRVPLQTMVAVVPPLLPVLKTNLEDYDASSRQLVTLSLERIFAALPGGLDDECVRQLYPELLKRLDDSSDDVRKSACACISSFLSAALPQVFQGGVLDYMLDQLFVHLDDQDVDMQEAVLSVLKAAAEKVDAALVEKKAQAARVSQRSPSFCDELLEAIRRNRS